MFFFKSCPRCSGDQRRIQDYFGEYVVCLACAFVKYLERETAMTATKAFKTA